MVLDRLSEEGVFDIEKGEGSIEIFDGKERWNSLELGLDEIRDLVNELVEIYYELGGKDE